ncbi:MAG: hypothetical protein HZB79_01450 [Deltaproteobacteria bacterium]|nr:hypothetical protein [Deltaproteobacteria bacterium]
MARKKVVEDIHKETYVKSQSGFIDRWVAYFDILGFSSEVEKGCRSDYLLLKDYKYIIKILSDACQLFPDCLSYFYFSDSFLIYSHDDTAKSYKCIQSASKKFINLMTLKRIPMRGVISFGDLYADQKERIFIGRALIEAVEAEKQLKTIGIVMMKTAVDKAKAYEERPENSGFREIENQISAEISSEESNQYDFDGCLYYTFLTSHGKFNFENPIEKNLRRMKRSAPTKVQNKYDNAIKHCIKHALPKIGTKT